MGMFLEYFRIVRVVDRLIFSQFSHLDIQHEGCHHIRHRKCTQRKNVECIQWDIIIKCRQHKI